MASLCGLRITHSITNIYDLKTNMSAKIEPERVLCTSKLIGGLSNKRLLMHQTINGYAHAEVAVPRATNKTIYVLADSWRSLSANSCQACLRNASASMMGCLPWSKGRALYARCFLRYSDVNFLNAIANSGDSSSNGNVMVIVISVVSAVVVFVLGVVIAFYMWKNKQIQKKRKGSNDVEKLVKTLNDSSLNFKYSTLEKATISFNEANKLGQGGFGTVYKEQKAT